MGAALGFSCFSFTGFAKCGAQFPCPVLAFGRYDDGIMNVHLESGKTYYSKAMGTLVIGGGVYQTESEQRQLGGGKTIGEPVIIAPQRYAGHTGVHA